MLYDLLSFSGQRHLWWLWFMAKELLMIVLCNIIFKLMKAKSLYRSRAGSHFYGTEYEIWADYEDFFRAIFLCFQEQKKTKNKKLHYISFIKKNWIVFGN